MIGITFFLSMALVARGLPSPGFLGLWKADTRIIGGSDAKNGKFPFQVSFKWTRGNIHFCGGSILNQRFILTAAHCTDGETIRSMKVVVGTNQLNTGGNIYNVDQIRMHKGFDRITYVNDIAIVKLSEDVVMSDKVKAISIANTDTVAGEDLLISGWGYTSISYPPNNLQKLKTKSISMKDCQTTHKNYGLWGAALWSKQLCTLTTRDTGACHGDSGGPVINKDGKQVGVVSWGLPCARGEPDVHTRVKEYATWIKDNSQLN